MIATIVIALIAGGWTLHRARRATSSRNTAPLALNGGVAAPDVAWQIEHREGSRYVLRKIGSDVAEHVDADESRAPTINRGLPVATLGR
jgi:hypothetical protein